MKRKLTAALLSILLMLAPCVLPSAQASVPKLITYHGLLKNSGGSYLTGTYSIVFKLYNVSTGGSALWTETQSSVSVSSGRFSVILGSGTALNLDFDADYWLGVTVGADSEMTPRQRLTSTGYAYMAEKVVNGFTQTQHDALSHRNIEGVRENTVNIAKTNFKLDAYSAASANSMKDMLIDVFTDASGISSGSSSDYTWRGTPNFDVVKASGGIDSYVVLIPHGNGTDGSTSFTDSSSSAHTITANGNAQIDTAQSKFGGASALFDGSNDNLTIPDSANWDFGTGDFTIDFWVRFSSVSSDRTLIDVGKGTTTGVRATFVDSATDKLRITINNSEFDSNWSPSTNTWYHIEIVRSGTSVYRFIDGTQVGSTGTNSSNISGSTEGVRIGETQTGAEDFAGWLDELRLSKGVARHTANFTPPTAEYAAPAGSATVISTVWTQSSAPTDVMVIAASTLNTGSITYHVSRDNGTTWTQVTPETITSITSQPSGTQVKWKAVITGDAELDSIAVAV